MEPAPRSKVFVSVVAIVSFLVGLACGIGFMVVAFVAMRPRVLSEFHRSTRQKIAADVTTIKEALDSYAMSNLGNYPARLRPLVEPDMNGFRHLRQATIPSDPWGREYGYEPPSAARPQPRVFTLGRDGVEGGEDEDADVDFEAVVNGW